MHLNQNTFGSKFGMHVKGQWPPKGPSEAKQIPPRILDIACKATSTILSLLRLSRVWGGLRLTPIPPPDIPLEQLAISNQLPIFDTVSLIFQEQTLGQLY